MGFEQLAALKKQLAEQAKAERAAKAEKSAKPTKPAKAGKGARPPRSKQPAPSAGAGKTVDPVVLAIARLQKRFPRAFPKNPAPKVPLKIGIFEDLLPHAQELALTESEMRDAIRTWCRGNRYWTSMVEGAARVDLAGQEAGNVSQADARRAQHLQARRTAKPQTQAASAPSPEPSDPS